MERKIFLENSVSVLGLAFVAPLLKSCSKEGITTVNAGTNSGSCEVTPTETAGPFPTITPPSLVSANIVSDRKGVPLTVKLTINNSKNGCAAVSDAIGDVWHCDAGGNYSEYGGSAMQSTNYTSVHFLRGRQTTNASGLVTFTSIFPGWYSGRAPHIHVHDCFRCYSTFNFGNYFNEHKYPFGDLYVLNDHCVAGGHSVSLHIEENSVVLLLPVVGTVLCKINGSNTSLVNAGQLQIFKVPPGAEIELLNCYENELINFIEVCIKADVSGSNDVNQLFTFCLDENKNQFIKITESTIAESGNPIVSIGKFAGRQETVYEVKNKENNLFVFVIEGVFEVQGRLLDARDGLGLWNELEKIELEALSNNAIVLIIEMSKI